MKEKALRCERRGPQKLEASRLGASGAEVTGCCIMGIKLRLSTETVPTEPSLGSIILILQASAFIFFLLKFFRLNNIFPLLVETQHKHRGILLFIENKNFRWPDSLFADYQEGKLGT